MTPSDLFEFRNNNFQIRFKLYKSTEIIESKLFSVGKYKCIQSLNILLFRVSRLHCNLRMHHQVHFWLKNDYKTFWKIIVRFALQMKNHCYSHTLEIIVNRPYSTVFIFSIIVYSRILFLCTNFPKTNQNSIFNRFWLFRFDSSLETEIFFKISKFLNRDEKV